MDFNLFYFPSGVFFLDNYHLIAALVEDSDGLGLRFKTNDLLHHVLLFHSSWQHHRGTLWPDCGSDHALRRFRRRR